MTSTAVLLATDAAESDAVEVATLGFVLGILALGLTLLAVLLRHGVALYRARVAAGREDELRAALTAATAAQERTEARLAELSQRFGALERVLKDVE